MTGETIIALCGMAACAVGGAFACDGIIAHRALRRARREAEAAKAHYEAQRAARHLAAKHARQCQLKQQRTLVAETTQRLRAEVGL